MNNADDRDSAPETVSRIFRKHLDDPASVTPEDLRALEDGMAAIKKMVRDEGRKLKLEEAALAARRRAMYDRSAKGGEG